MKKAICLLFVISFFIQSCSFVNFSNVGEVKTLAVLAGIAAYEIGYTVAKTEDAEIDRAVRNAYTLTKTGKLSQDGLNQITDLIALKVPDRPTLPRSIMSLFQLVGVQFNADGEAIGLDEIPPEVFAAVEENYLAGFDLYQKVKSGEVAEAEADEILGRLRQYRAEIEGGRFHVFL